MIMRLYNSKLQITVWWFHVILIPGNIKSKRIRDKEKESERVN